LSSCVRVKGKLEPEIRVVIEIDSDQDKDNECNNDSHGIDKVVGDM
jgi:hypothetical protein